MEYLERRFPAFDYYLAVQDGMDPYLVYEALFEEKFSGLFVGGTKEWMCVLLGSVMISTISSQELVGLLGGLG